ncbi:ABC transporter permease [Phytomonospora endophytica]|uniref:ABC-2 type transport system permease protein n=1 Tax=Phytomonospora endophytica TaxID=714109 RepID=A0A841FBG8_9ACTN|nr:ABC transporter permease [Phytomonospora endophytica]MBB6032675.1 ABC-2 type transport system permease protein [Phytomonospora endophytica]GIG66175.1 exporter of polyketide antibiotics [Phytomonospora endophytica]
MTALAGTGSLIRLALRRDRWLLPIWLVLFIVIVQSSASAWGALYDTPEERASIISQIGTNPTFKAIYGINYGDTADALFAWRYGATIGVFVALMSLLIVTRHTRAEEESGRLELVSAGVVGRLAPLTSSLIVVFGANLLLAAAVTGILTGAGFETTGSLAFALGLALSGILFATIAGLTAQITESARFANALAGIVLGATYLLRALGDTSEGLGWLSWLSPTGWAARLKPYAGEQWWVAGLFLGVALVVGVVAYVLNLRRDFGAGLVAPRPGPARGAASLGTPLALAWRLQRGLLYGWIGGFVFLGAIFGGVANGVDDIFGANPEMEEIVRKLGQGTLVEVYMDLVMGMVALIVSVYSIQAALRLRSEETGLLAEPVLATAVGRVRWAVSHLVFAVLGPALLLLVGGTVMGLIYGLAIDDVGGQVGTSVRSSLVQLPAVWVLTGFALLLFGFLPRLIAAAWAALVVFVLLGQLGPILELSQGAMDVSPFTHIPKTGGEAFTATPLIWLVGIAAVLCAAGLYGFRRRDLATAG